MTESVKGPPEKTDQLNIKEFLRTDGKQTKQAERARGEQSQAVLDTYEKMPEIDGNLGWVIKGWKKTGVPDWAYKFTEERLSRNNVDVSNMERQVLGFLAETVAASRPNWRKVFKRCMVWDVLQDIDKIGLNVALHCTLSDMLYDKPVMTIGEFIDVVSDRLPKVSSDPTDGASAGDNTNPMEIGGQDIGEIDRVGMEPNVSDNLLVGGGLDQVTTSAGGMALSAGWMLGNYAVRPL